MDMLRMNSLESEHITEQLTKL